MAPGIQRLAALTAIALLAGCGSSSSPGPSPAPNQFVVTATPASVTADGVQAVTVTVTGTATGPVSLSTTRGAFSSGYKGIQLASLPSTVALITCNAASDSTCAGSALIRAGDTVGSYGEASVVFTSTSPPSPTCTTCGTTSCVGQVCDATGRVCSSGSPSTCSVCPPGATGCATTGQVTLSLEAAATRIPADGIATTTITATLLQDATPLPGQTIAFTSSLAGTALSTPAVTDANGQTTVVLTSSATHYGDTTVAATYPASGTISARADTVVTMPRLGQLTVLGYQFEVLGARYSDFQERSTVTFQALDTASQPYPPGLTVTFTHDRLGLSFIGDSEANCPAGTARCQATGVTAEDGTVLVTLTSGTAAGVVSIVGNASAGGLSANAIAHRLAIIGAKASGSYVVMDCEQDNVPALLYGDCVASHLVQAVTCKVSLRDRFQNVVGRSTRVQFFAEAGSTGMSAVTPMYPGGVAAGGESDLGIAVSAIRTDGKLPVDVAPFGGEFSLTYPDACGTYTHNPRDGLVTMIGIVNGEEGFVDWNGNGRYDAGEPYIDEGEPFVDANDNGRYDAGEFFIDVNSNGAFDGPDGKWTQNAVLWAETRVLFTGHSFVSGSSGSRFIPATPFSVNSATPGPATSQFYTVAFSDRNFNPLATSTAYSVSTRTGNATAEFAPAPLPPFGHDISFTQQYCTKPNWEEITDSNMCGNVCPSNGSTTNSPCYIVTNVGNCTAGVAPRAGCNGFAYATTGTVKVTGGPTPGTDTVEATASIEEVTSSIFLGGTVH